MLYAHVCVQLQSYQGRNAGCSMQTASCIDYYPKRTMSGNGWGSYLSDLAFRAKAVALNVTRTELIVLEATNEEAWGPHGSAMSGTGRHHVHTWLLWELTE